MFLGVFLPTVATFFELKMCMYCPGFILLFFLHQQVRFFVFLSEFNHCISSKLSSCRKVLLMKNVYNSICGNFLPELTSLGSLICIRKFHKKLFLTLTVGRSHYMTLVSNTEQYNKGAKWI